MRLTRSEIKLFEQQVNDAITAGDGQTIVLQMTEHLAKLFVEFLYDFDPDTPPRPLMKALGPLVGDMMMNAKLQRLDEIADKLGPMIMLLMMTANQLERIATRASDD